MDAGTQTQRFKAIARVVATRFVPPASSSTSASHHATLPSTASEAAILPFRSKWAVEEQSEGSDVSVDGVYFALLLVPFVGIGDCHHRSGGCFDLLRG